MLVELTDEEIMVALAATAYFIISIYKEKDDMGLPVKNITDIIINGNNVIDKLTDILDERKE